MVLYPRLAIPSNRPPTTLAILVQYAGNLTHFWASVYLTSSHSSSQRLRNSVMFVLSKNNAPASPGRGIRKWYTGAIGVMGLDMCSVVSDIGELLLLIVD